MLYFLVGSRGLDGGLMCTASHNPKPYTGAKLVREGALALSGDSGIGDIRARVPTGCPSRRRPGPRRARRRLPGVPARALSFIDPAAIRPLKVVLDGGNGMAGPMVGPILERLDGLELIPTYWEPDGEFPDHEPNPLLPENRRFVIDKVRSEGADLGSPGTATPTAASSSTATATSSTAISSPHCSPRSVLESHPGADILYDVRASRAVAGHRAGRRRHGARQPRRPRVLQEPHARARAACSAARSLATTTSPTSTTPTPGRSRRC